MSKYIDLEDTLLQSCHKAHDYPFVMDVKIVLAWLDSHPEQAPGRTHTASEFDEAVESCITEDGTVPPHEFAERLGVVCVPDPVQTNAEKLADILHVAMQEDGWGDEGEANILAAALEAAGVKAMGGDE